MTCILRIYTNSNNFFTIVIFVTFFYFDYFITLLSFFLILSFAIFLLIENLSFLSFFFSSFLTSLFSDHYHRLIHFILTACWSFYQANLLLELDCKVSDSIVYINVQLLSVEDYSTGYQCCKKNQR